MLPLIRLHKVDSTQSYLDRHPELGCCIVMAESQTAGRGRGGRAWESASGAGLWLSARLPMPNIHPGRLLQSAMAAVIGVLTPCGVPLGIKWPNDLVAWSRKGADTALVKLGGIIGEQRADLAVLGLGINIFGAPEIPQRPIPPASLSSLGALAIPEMHGLAEKILVAWQRLGVSGTESDCNNVSFWWPAPGDWIRWEEGKGVCQGWEPDGRLAVFGESGLVLLASGDVCGLGQ